MKQDISIIASRLRSEYLNNAEQQENFTYEQAVKLNIEMIEKALQMYHEKLMERERKLFKRF